jgi:hypothetical protein
MAEDRVSRNVVWKVMIEGLEKAMGCLMESAFRRRSTKGPK